MSAFWAKKRSIDRPSSDHDDDSSSEESVCVRWCNDFVECEDDDKDDNDNRLSCDTEHAWKRLQPYQLDVDPLLTTVARSAKQHTSTSDHECTRLVCMSDTHGQHREIFLPTGDVLIHAGDFTKTGEVGSIQDLSRYFQESLIDEIVCIAGNHDMTLDPTFYQRSWQRFHAHHPFDTAVARASLQNCIYLQDESSTVHQGKVVVYGSPWTPEFYDWAFNLPRGKPLREVWSQIPNTTDVLITHGPPLGRCDLSSHGIRTGCYDLLQEIQQRVKPRVHVFGHIHEGCGVSFDGTTLFVNASNLNLQYQPVNPCFVIDLPLDKRQPAKLVVPTCAMSGLDFVLWCKTHNYSNLASYLEATPVEMLPSGNDLLQHRTFQTLSDMLGLHRDEETRLELHRALSQLYALSY